MRAQHVLRNHLKCHGTRLVEELFQVRQVLPILIKQRGYQRNPGLPGGGSGSCRTGLRILVDSRKKRSGSAFGNLRIRIRPSKQCFFSCFYRRYDQNILLESFFPTDFTLNKMPKIRNYSILSV